MRRTIKKIREYLLVCLMVTWCVVPCSAEPQEVSGKQPKNESRSRLDPAVEALKGGNEARAWELYSTNAKQYSKRWAELDGSFVVWVADQYRKQTRYNEAMDLCNTVIAMEGQFKPEHVAAIMLVKGNIFCDQQNYAGARMEYQAIERNSIYKDTEAGKTAGFRVIDIYRLTKDYNSAQELLERLKDYPDVATQAEAYYHSARIAFDQDSYDEVRQYLGEVKKRVPNHLEALFLEAELNLKEDKLQDPEMEIGSRVLVTYVAPGRPMTMKMQDLNLAIARGGGGIPVELTTSKGEDKEIVTLLPSPRDPTLFRATISTLLGDAATNSTRMEITGADVITYNLLESFQKANDLNYPDKKILVVADAELNVSAGEFVSAEERDKELLDKRIAQAGQKESKSLSAYELKRDTSIVRPGNDIYIQIKDLDRDLGAEQDKVFVSAVTSSGDAVQGIELTEIKAHSGIFQGRVPTAKAPPRATASDTEKGKNPNSTISLSNQAVWSTEPDGKKGKWLEIDLMTIHPMEEASLELAEAGNVKAVSLFGGAGKDLVRVATTHPSKEEIYGYVDLAKHFEKDNPSQTAGYLYTEVTSDIACDAVFKIGSCDGVTCWLNGKQVHINLGGRMWKPEEDVVQVKLKAGINAILLRVTQLTGPWGASLTILDTKGKRLPSVKSCPPTQDGVVTQWHVFDRLTPENIEVAKRINVERPVRIEDKQFKWVPISVGMPASLRVEGNLLKATFNYPIGLQRLQWVFDDYVGPSVSVKAANVKNKFGEEVVPAAVDYSAAAANRQLELGPGDRIDISYRDERRIRSQEVLTASMRSSFHNGSISMEYETISLVADEQRRISYDRAIRYRAGITSNLVVRVVDYDADTSSESDKIKVLVETSVGEKLWLEALETENHSGAFIAILRLGTTTGKDTIKVSEDVTITVSYADHENSDGQIERTTGVKEAADDDPELLLYQCNVQTEEKSIDKVKKIGDKSKTKAVSSQLVKREGDSVKKPIVTSLDAPLLFRAIYPEAALSAGSSLPAIVVTERELKAAEQEGRKPNYLKVNMKLSDAELAEFEAQVAMRTGDKSSYADDDDKASGLTLYVRNDDIIRVTIAAIDSDLKREGYYKLASDGSLLFTDRKYEVEAEKIYIGDFFYLWSSDRDKDVSDGLDEVTVSVRGKAGDHNLVLVETLPHSGVFTGRAMTKPVGKADADVGKLSSTGTVDIVKTHYGETLKAVYKDESCVVSANSREITASLAIFPGADGTLATFTKLFSDPEIAVKTRLLTAEALFEMAKDHRETGQKDLAASEFGEGKMILEEAIADYPNTKQTAHAQFLLANLAQELEKYEEALERYNIVLANWSDSEQAPRAQLKKGICLEKMNDYDNALDAYVEMTYSYPKSPLVADAVIRLGQYFYRTKKYDVAGRIFSNFHDHNKEHPLAPKTLFLSGQSYMKGTAERKIENKGQSDATCEKWLMEAVRKFSKIVDSYDDKDLRSETMWWLADCYIEVQDMKNAYITLKRLTWDYPESKWAKFARGRLAQHASDFEKIEID